MLVDANMVARESFNLGDTRPDLWLIELSPQAAHFVAHDGPGFLALFLATFVLGFVVASRRTPRSAAGEFRTSAILTSVQKATFEFMHEIEMAETFVRIAFIAPSRIASRVFRWTAGPPCFLQASKVVLRVSFPVRVGQLQITRLRRCDPLAHVSDRLVQIRSGRMRPTPRGSATPPLAPPTQSERCGRGHGRWTPSWRSDPQLIRYLEVCRETMIRMRFGSLGPEDWAWKRSDPYDSRRSMGGKTKPLDNYSHVTQHETMRGGSEFRVEAYERLKANESRT